MNSLIMNFSKSLYCSLSTITIFNIITTNRCFIGIILVTSHGPDLCTAPLSLMLPWKSPGTVLTTTYQEQPHNPALQLLPLIQLCACWLNAARSGWRADLENLVLITVVTICVSSSRSLQEVSARDLSPSQKSQFERERESICTDFPAR